MKARRFIYLVAFIIIGLIVYKYGNGNEITPPASIDKQAIFKDFSDLKDNDVPAGQLGGTYYTTQIAFPDDFIGDAGDEFYVSMEDGHNALTQRYIIAQVNADNGKSGKLVYKLKANWENHIPPASKYETYKYDGNKWTKVSTKK